MAQINYSNRDFQSIKNDLLARAAVIMPEWSSRDASDFGVLLVDLWAYYADILHYYVDRSAREAFIGTATQRESMLAIANLFDYLPQMQKAATATLTVVGANIPENELVVIPSGTIFAAPATSTRPIVYYTSTSSASATAASSAVIAVVEGEQVNDESLGTSNGQGNQRFSLFYPKVVGNSVVIHVAEGPLVNNVPSLVEYQYIPKMFDATTTDRFFSLVLNAANETEVIFGNGVSGKIPNAGQTITASYRKGKGLFGNVPANTITQILNSPSPYLSEVYSTVASGGADAESIAALKANIPAAFSTQNRAVSLNDYKVLVLNIAGIGKGTAEYDSPTKTVTIYAVPMTSEYLTYSGSTLSVSSAVQDAVIAYYEPRQMLGATVSVAASIDLTSVDITATVYVLSGHTASKVKVDVEVALDSFFEYDAVYFNQTLSKGEIYRKILNVAGVDYVTISDPSSETVTSGALALFKKGTYTITTSGGVTGA